MCFNTLENYQYRIHFMKKLLLLTFISFYAITIYAQTNQKSTTYYLIRHAEKDRSDKTNKNPNLIKKGVERAQKWAETFKEIHFDMVYSTNYARTKATASPTALNNNLELTIYNPKSLDYELFKKETKGKTVLIVGHSNTTPVFVNKILNTEKYEDIEDSNNANLYIVTIVGGITNDQLLCID